MDNAETVPRPVISFRLLGNVQKNGQLDNELLPYLNNTLGIIRLRCKPDGWKRIMSATSQRNEKHKDNPLCSCCGVIMDLYGRDFATKVRIDVWITTVIIHNVVAIIGRGKKKNAKMFAVQIGNSETCIESTRIIGNHHFQIP